MPGHQFRNLTTSALINVMQTNHGLRIGPNGSNYSGICEWQVVDNRTLEIHTLDAQPDGHGLGSILMFATALEGFANGLEEVTTLATATTALNFYLKMGLRPQNAYNTQSSYDLADPDQKKAFGLRVLGRYKAAVWFSSMIQMKAMSQAVMMRNWNYVRFV